MRPVRLAATTATTFKSNAVLIRSVSIIDITSLDCRSALSTLKAGPKTNDTENLGSIDHYFDTDRIKKTPGQGTRRDFNYFVLGGGRVLWATGARLALMSVSRLAEPCLCIASHCLSLCHQ
jgi:hypothetical protein